MKIVGGGGETISFNLLLHGYLTHLTSFRRLVNCLKWAIGNLREPPKHQISNEDDYSRHNHSVITFLLAH